MQNKYLCMWIKNSRKLEASILLCFNKLLIIEEWNWNNAESAILKNKNVLLKTIVYVEVDISKYGGKYYRNNLYNFLYFVCKVEYTKILFPKLVQCVTYVSSLLVTWPFLTNNNIYSNISVSIISSRVTRCLDFSGFVPIFNSTSQSPLDVFIFETNVKYYKFLLLINGSLKY